MTPTLAAENAGQQLRAAPARADFLPRQKFSVEGKAEDSGREIEIIAPDFTPRQKIGKGRPPSPVKFVIRPFDGGFGVWLVQPSKRRKYCCHLDGTEVNKIRRLDFATFGDYVLGRIRARQRTTQSAAKIDALLSTIPQLIAQARRAGKS